MGASSRRRWTLAVTSAASFTVVLGALVMSALISGGKGQS